MAKIGDFGLARFEDKSKDKYTNCGTPFWAAPEIIKSGKYSPKADVYSFAIVMYEMIARKDPYGNLNSIQVPFKVADEGLRPVIPSICPQSYRVLMKQCWSQEPRSRPTFKYVIEKFVNILNESYAIRGVKPSNLNHLLRHGDERTKTEKQVAVKRKSIYERENNSFINSPNRRRSSVTVVSKMENKSSK